jgi:hypothetical protein
MSLAVICSVTTLTRFCCSVQYERYPVLLHSIESILCTTHRHAYFLMETSNPSCKHPHYKPSPSCNTVWPHSDVTIRSPLVSWPSPEPAVKGVGWVIFTLIRNGIEVMFCFLFWTELVFVNLKNEVSNLLKIIQIWKSRLVSLELSGVWESNS